MRRRRLSLVVATLLVQAGHAGCAKSSGDALPGARTTATTATDAGRDVDTAPRASATAKAATVGGHEWRGTYLSAATTVYVPADWKGVHWKGADTAVGIGQGSMALEIDGATGRVTGTLEGPLGPARIEGLFRDDKLSAAVVRKDPADHGFVGTLVGIVGNGRVEGTINVALWDASALRSATFALSSQPSQHEG